MLQTLDILTKWWQVLCRQKQGSCTSAMFYLDFARGTCCTPWYQFLNNQCPYLILYEGYAHTTKRPLAWVEDRIILPVENVHRNNYGVVEGECSAALLHRSSPCVRWSRRVLLTPRISTFSSRGKALPSAALAQPETEQPIHATMLKSVNRLVATSPGSSSNFFVDFSIDSKPFELSTS